MLRLLLASLFITVCSPALAVYKCESSGKLSYSDAPCPDGKGIIIKETMQPDAVIDANTRLLRDSAEASRLERERHQREAQAEKEWQQTTRLAAKNKKKCDSLALRKKWADEDASLAAGKSADKTRRKARRTAEKYALECERK